MDDLIGGSKVLTQRYDAPLIGIPYFSVAFMDSFPTLPTEDHASIHTVETFAGPRRRHNNLVVHHGQMEAVAMSRRVPGPRP